MNVQLAGKLARATLTTDSVRSHGDECPQDHPAVPVSGCREWNRSTNQRAEYYVGIASNTPQCPAIRYLFRGVFANPIGDVWFADASGMSKATGTMDLASGRFHFT